MFQLMRPTNRIVYEPKLKYAEGQASCPPMPRNPFGWLLPLWRMKERDLLPIIGLDAVAYLRFTRMMRWCATLIGVVLCTVLIPVDVTSNIRDRHSDSDSGGGNTATLVMITMRNVHGSYLWAHVVMSYFATMVALGFLWYNWRHMLRLRWDWFRSPEYQNSLHARTLLITHVGPSLRSDKALADVLERFQMPYPTTDVFIGRDMGLLPDLIDRHKHMVRQLERALVWYIRSPTSVRSRRPTTRIGAVLGIGGRKVDSIDYYSDQIEQLETSIEDERLRTADKRPVSYGFASMGAVHYAHAAGRSLYHKRPHGLKIQLAPPPNAIIWRNLTLGSWQRFRTSVVAFLLLTALLFANAVPLTGVNLITNMSLFATSGVTWTEGAGSQQSTVEMKHPLIKWLYEWRESSKLSFAAVAGVVPPLVSAVASWLLPIFMRRLAKYRGITSKVTTDRVILGQYYGYLVISQLVVFTLIGVVINLLIIVGVSAQHGVKGSKLLNRIQLPQLPENIKQQYAMLGNYWLTWMPLKVVLVFLDLAQGIKLLYVWLHKGLVSKTPRDVRELTEPPFFEYSNYYANLLFVGAVVMVYALLSPLIVVLGAVVFWAYSIANKYQLMYVNQTKHETGGKLWQSASNRFLVNLLLMQGILILSLVLDDPKEGYRAVACLPPMLFVFGFKIYARITFESKFDWYIPSPEEASQIRIHRGDQQHHRLERRFGHPFLTQKLQTPMVHAWSQALLPEVYHGRIDETKHALVDGRNVETAAVEGGLKIAFVEEDQLEYDPRNDNDDDARSVMSSTTLASNMPLGGAGGGKRSLPGPSPLGAGYQQHTHSVLPASGAEEFEMGSIYPSGEKAARNSKETLLLGSEYYPQHPGLAPRQLSASSLSMYKSPYEYNKGLEYTPALQSQVDLSKHPPTRPMSPAPSSYGLLRSMSPAPSYLQARPVSPAPSYAPHALYPGITAAQGASTPLLDSANADAEIHVDAGADADAAAGTEAGEPLGLDPADGDVQHIQSSAAQYYDPYQPPHSRRASP